MSLLWLERLFTLPSPLYTLCAMLCLPLRPNLPSVAQVHLPLLSNNLCNWPLLLGSAASYLLCTSPNTKLKK